MVRSKRPARTRDDIVKELLDLFFIFGYNGTTLSLIAERTGLGRASLYHHFPGGKEEMARAVLQQADAWGDAHICSLRNAHELPADERLRVTLNKIDSVHYRPEQLSPANAFTIGEGALLYREHVATRFRNMALLVGELLQAIGLPENVARRRGWELQLLWEGGLVSARVLNDMSIFRDLMRNMPAYLLAPADVVGSLPADFVPPEA